MESICACPIERHEQLSIYLAQEKRITSVKLLKDWVEDFTNGRVSRREFVERAAVGGLSLFATASVLRDKAHADGGEVRGDHDHNHRHGQQHSRAHDHHHGQRRKGPHAQSRNRNQTNVSPWEEWLKAENIPVYRDYHISDLRTVEIKPWRRLGPRVRGAHIDLVGSEGINSGYVCEISAHGSTVPQRYLFEEVLYILNGDGETMVWNPNGRSKQSVRWQPGSVIAPPLNVWRQHFNRGDKPVRFLSMTNAPLVIDLFHSSDFVFNNDYVFRGRYQGEADYFGAGPEKMFHKETSDEESEIQGGVHTWDSGFIPDVRKIGLRPVKERGAANSRIELQLSDNALQAHVSEFDVGTYKKAHRHGPGSHVVMLNGKGYTLMWKGAVKYSEASTHMRIDWKEGSLFVPPDGWFHQHFNAGNDAARYLAPTWGGDGKWFMKAVGGGSRTHRLGKTSIRKGGNLIEYEDEDPAIREIFEAELRKNGVDIRMPSR
jgi:mannose-6-phosphate isomerase-like protein (cupin superfamily)